MTAPHSTSALLCLFVAFGLICAIFFRFFSDPNHVFFPLMSKQQRYLHDKSYKQLAKVYQSYFGNPPEFAISVPPLESKNHSCLFSSLTNNHASMEYDYLVFRQVWPVSVCHQRFAWGRYCNVAHIKSTAYAMSDLLDEFNNDNPYEKWHFKQEVPFIVDSLRGMLLPHRRIRAQQTGPKCCLRSNFPDASKPLYDPISLDSSAQSTKATQIAKISSQNYDEQIWPDLLYPPQLLRDEPNQGTIVREWQQHGSCLIHEDSVSKMNDTHAINGFDNYLLMVNSLASQYNLTDPSDASPIASLQKPSSSKSIPVATIMKQLQDRFSLPSYPLMYCIDVSGYLLPLLLGVGFCLDKHLDAQREAKESGRISSYRASPVACPQQSAKFYGHTDIGMARLCREDERVYLPDVDSLHSYWTSRFGHVFRHSAMHNLRATVAQLRDDGVNITLADIEYHNDPADAPDFLMDIPRGISQDDELQEDEGTEVALEEQEEFDEYQSEDDKPIAIEVENIAVKEQLDESL